MRQRLARHLEAVLAVLGTTLVSAVALGAVVFTVRKPVPAPIVIQSITPFPTQTKAPTATPGPIRVYVSGAVARPGVYSLSWDSRVEEAVVAAGGAVQNADLLQVNLAQHVQDEQQIYVPLRVDSPTPPLRTVPQATPLQPTPVPRSTSTRTPTPASQKIRINTASLDELESLPGIGPVLAQRIIDYRQDNGPFAVPEDIKKVKGIGDKTFEKLKDLITVE